MFQLIPTLKRAFPFLGLRSVNEIDLFNFCETRSIDVIFCDDVEMGAYAVCEDYHFIFLNSKLYGWSLLYVFAHEVGHYLFHMPSQSNMQIAFFSDAIKRKNHVEAEQVAALLLLPLRELESVLANGIHQGNSDLADLVSTRLRILDLTGQ